MKTPTVVTPTVADRLRAIPHTLEEGVDWVEFQVIPEPLDQGACGSCGRYVVHAPFCALRP